MLTFINSALFNLYGKRMETVWQAYGNLRVNLSAMIVNRSMILTYKQKTANEKLIQATEMGAQR
jgi:hypothetical protein